MKDPFDAWLEQRLTEGYSRLGRRPVRPFSTGRLPRFGWAFPAALGAKAVAGFAVAALAAAGGGVAIARTVDPTAFGQTVKSQTTTCKEQTVTSTGSCVSNYVVGHNPGASQRSSSAQPGSTQHGSSTNHGSDAGGQSGSHPDRGSNPKVTPAPHTTPAPNSRSTTR